MKISSAISALQTAMQGIRRGVQGLQRNAAEIASADSFNEHNPADLAKPMVEMAQHRLQVEASAKAVRTVDEAIGSLFDDKA